MPIFDFACPTVGCGGFKVDVYLPLRSSEKPLCLDCNTRMETCLALGNQHIAASAFPYVTKNIHPDGKAIEVRSPGHLKELCKTFNVTPRDDAAFIEKEWLGYDMRTKKHVYREGAGVGLPGCWV